MTSLMGTIDLSTEASEDEGSQWWMFENESVPYSPEKDAEIPVGTVIPGVLIEGEYSGSRQICWVGPGGRTTIGRLKSSGTWIPARTRTLP